MLVLVTGMRWYDFLTWNVTLCASAHHFLSMCTVGETPVYGGYDVVHGSALTSSSLPSS